MNEITIHTNVTVTMPYWQWVYLLGWITAHEGVNEHAPSEAIASAIGNIEAAVIP